VNPPARNVAECTPDQNSEQWVLADLPRNGTGRATTRINDVLRHSARLRPSLLCRFARLAQHFFCLTGCRRGSRGSILNYLLAWPAAAAVASVALCTRSPIASPAFVTRASEEVSFIIFLHPTSSCPASY
jgi:hypothetical protein